MAPSVFLDKQLAPSATSLSSALGKSKAMWDEIRQHVISCYAPTVEGLGYAGKQYGWSLGLKQKKRSVAHLIPGEGKFVCSLAFSEKAVAETRKSKLPADVMKMIADSKRFPEGRAVRLEVNSKRDAAIATELIDIRMRCI